MRAHIPCARSYGYIQYGWPPFGVRPRNPAQWRMAKSKRSLSRREEENRFAYQAHRITVIFATINRIVVGVTWVACAYFLHLSVLGVAGKTTFADIGLKLLANVSISQGVAYIFGAGCAVYGYKERNLRRKNVERITRRNREMEQVIDPGRSTSALTPRGDTNPGDKL